MRTVGTGTYHTLLAAICADDTGMIEINFFQAVSLPVPLLICRCLFVSDVQFFYSIAAINQSIYEALTNLALPFLES